ncbi:hypothetical protein A0H76_2711 [Hepatospora eriocheir]|uniref:Uncharacterized protein n=1 Tax=Hepatospora eriocheir TaxID=1081669 RepID=A0A1X0QJJ1_9MICR|nr:hypothetical protein A0H76_2711 [Hepatospora eriocheir]
MKNNKNLYTGIFVVLVGIVIVMMVLLNEFFIVTPEERIKSENESIKNRKVLYEIIEFYLSKNNDIKYISSCEFKNKLVVLVNLFNECVNYDFKRLLKNKIKLITILLV